MSDVKWCDAGQHPFTTAREGWISSQAVQVIKGQKRVATIDICAEHAGDTVFGGASVEEDDIETRLRALETRKAADERKELEELRDYRRQVEQAAAERAKRITESSRYGQPSVADQDAVSAYPSQTRTEDSHTGT